MLAVLRELPHLVAEQTAHRWAPVHTDGLDGKRVLVLGAGDIGRRVAAAVAPLDATATLIARTARGEVGALADVPRLLPAHDVVVVALPHTPLTHRLVDAAFLAAMPDGALLVNVARGPVVDTGALLAELTTRRLRAFLDVTDPEPLPAGHPLWNAPNLLLTPHVGGGTAGWQRRAYALVRAQLARYLAGEELANVVREGY
jgi:phosphoglycerate dehydrogenase-like enzyme